MEATRQVVWANRIVGYGEIAPDQALANEQNWRIHPQAQQEALAGLLRQVGLVQNVVINCRTSPEWPPGQRNVETVVDGHLRIALAISEGQPTIPVTYVDLTPTEERLVLAALDPLGALAVPDYEQLDELLAGVHTASDALRGVLESLVADAPDASTFTPSDAEAQEHLEQASHLQTQWQVSPGDLWLVPSATVPGGTHRILCGDSAREADAERLLAGATADLLLADPPYNVGLDYGQRVDDERPRADYEHFTCTWFDLWRPRSQRQVVTPGGNNLTMWLRLFEPYHVAPWLKTNGTTRGKVARFWCWEPVLLYGDEEAWQPLLFFGQGWRRTRPNDVFSYPIGAQGNVGDHPCPKPLRLWLDLVRNYSRERAVVADPFAGAGTTAVACEQLGRLAYVCEVEPQYVAVVLERLRLLGLTPRRG